MFALLAWGNLVLGGGLYIYPQGTVFERPVITRFLARPVHVSSLHRQSPSANPLVDRSVVRLSELIVPHLFPVLPPRHCSLSKYVIQDLNMTFKVPRAAVHPVGFFEIAFSEMRKGPSDTQSARQVRWPLDS